MEKNENEELLEQSRQRFSRKIRRKLQRAGKKSRIQKNRKSPMEDLYSGVWRECICCIQVTVSVRDM